MQGRSCRTLILLTAVFVLLAVVAAPAFAERAYESQITGLTHPSGLSFDASGDLWVTDTGSAGLISEYGPFPSTTKIAKQDGKGHFTLGGAYVESASLNSLNNRLYVGDSGELEIHLFEGAGAWVTTWTGFGGGYLHIVVDNSGAASSGRVYASSSAGHVLAFDPAGNGANFSASAPYISGNQLTGTPTGPGSTTVPFGEPWRVAVDSVGNLYVVDRSAKVVDEFASSGEFIQQITETPEGAFAEVTGVAVDPSNDDVLIVDSGKNVIDEFKSSGVFLDQVTGTETPAESFSSLSGGITVNSTGNVYVADSGNGVVDIFSPAAKSPKVTYLPVENIAPRTATLKAGIDPNGGGDVETCEFEYGFTNSYGNALPCSPDPASGPPGSYFSSPTEVAGNLSGLQAATVYHYRAIATDSTGTRRGVDRTFETAPAVANVSTEAAQNIGKTTAELAGSYVGNGEDTSYHFEYGTSPNYGHVTATVDQGEVSGPQHVLAPIANLAANTTYYFRFIAENAEGVAVAHNEQTFTTDQAPTIDASSTSNVTATSADLHAEVDPHGFTTTYRFEYGTTSAYGQSIPVPDGEIGEELNLAHSVEAHLSGLQGVQYHFRIVAHNQWGTVASEDQTFEFFPPGCPNSAVRQQTGSAYLPDCRAYELVSPGNANGTLLYAGGPNTGEASSPSRLSFTGNGGSLKGTNTIETAADLYTATRTDSGWESKYIGLPGDEAGCMGGPPNSPTSHVVFQSPPYLTNTVLTDPSMSRFLLWPDGTPSVCFFGGNFPDGNWEVASPSNAPYMFSADGSINQRLPSSFAGGEEAVEALKCPYFSNNNTAPPCTSDVTASADLSHFVFSSNKASFAEGGLEKAPGSAYDNNLATNTVSLISLDSAGHPIAQDPSFANVPPEYDGTFGVALGGKEEFIRFPAISNDGSHILMSTATARTFPCDKTQSEPEPCERFTDTPIHLYMRVNDAISYEPSRGEDGINHAVKFLGMTPDGSKVFFTSEEQLTAEDKDTSTDLYMWSEATDSLTLVSKANDPGNTGEPGQSDGCNANASWTTKCGIQPYSNYEWSLLPGGEGGNGVSDSAITPGGDIYFYSPEQLDGDRGALGGQNLYDYREGKAQFVATLEPEKKCRPASPSPIGRVLCAEGPIVRFEATPNDSRAAFLTATQLTSYDNAGHIEMYSFTPSSGEIVCASCRPDGQAPIDDVKASQDGRFIANDGRVFFSAADPLVAQDTNEGIDVYEYVDGRPQLITPGTGTATAAGGQLNVAGFAERSGLVGVSNDGTDVYFDTFDVLTSEDNNGNFLKFYDARVNGGFAQPTPVPPCKAAEECHGAGSSAPGLPTQGTAAGISGGNAKQKAAAKKKHQAKKHKKAARKHHRTRAAKSKGRAGK